MARGLIVPHCDTMLSVLHFQPMVMVSFRGIVITFQATAAVLRPVLALLALPFTRLVFSVLVPI